MKRTFLWIVSFHCMHSCAVRSDKPLDFLSGNSIYQYRREAQLLEQPRLRNPYGREPGPEPPTELNSPSKWDGGRELKYNDTFVFRNPNELGDIAQDRTFSR